MCTLDVNPQIYGDTIGQLALRITEAVQEYGHFGCGGDSVEVASIGWSPSLSLWIALWCFLCLSGFFSSSETALFSLTKVQLHRLKRERRRGIRAIQWLLQNPRDTLTTILFANTFVNIAAALSAGALSRLYFSEHPYIAFFVGAIGITIVILILGEIVPKTLAIERAETIALHAARLLLVVSGAIIPVRKLLLAVSDFFFGILRIKAEPHAPFVTEEELKALLTPGETKNLLEEDEQRMINSIFELGQTTVEEIMMPRTEIEYYLTTTPQQELITRLKASQYSRVLICDKDLDNVIGILHAKHVLLNQETPYLELLRPPLFVPPKKGLTALLAEFKKSRHHLAVVIDEYGGTAGIVTMHDLLEEIVGVIREGTEARAEESFQELRHNEYLVPGKMEVSELNEHLPLGLSEDMGRTVSGFLTNTLGRIPQVNDEVELPNALFRIVKMGRNRVAVTHLTLRMPVGTSEAGGEEQP
jgi:putative hemolysin